MSELTALLLGVAIGIPIAAVIIKITEAVAKGRRS